MVGMSLEKKTENFNSIIPMIDEWLENEEKKPEYRRSDEIGSDSPEGVKIVSYLKDFDTEFMSEYLKTNPDENVINTLMHIKKHLDYHQGSFLNIRS